MPNSLPGIENRSLRRIGCFLFAMGSLFFLRPTTFAQTTADQAAGTVDSDHDGMSDQLEQALLERFAPTVSIGAQDCAGLPAEFARDVVQPRVKAENGTLYGQVTPLPTTEGAAPTAEVRYFHLWKTDCGRHGHPLDDEHVSALIRAGTNPVAAASWKAIDWYAAAHENTVCDVSQIASASAVHAEDRGAHVWVSPGKHASYLDPALCHAGCGADRCEKMQLLAPAKIINLGEVEHPMNGSDFIDGSGWQLAAKMSVTNFPGDAMARVDAAPAGSILWFNAGRHPAQGIIAISSTTEAGMATGETHAAAGIATGAQATGGALDTANTSTGNALQKSYRNTRHALGVSARKVGKALGVAPSPAETATHPPQ